MDAPRQLQGIGARAQHLNGLQVEGVHRDRLQEDVAHRRSKAPRANRDAPLIRVIGYRLLGRYGCRQPRRKTPWSGSIDRLKITPRRRHLPAWPDITRQAVTVAFCLGRAGPGHARYRTKGLGLRGPNTVSTARQPVGMDAFVQSSPPALLHRCRATTPEHRRLAAGQKLKSTFVHKVRPGSLMRCGLSAR